MNKRLIITQIDRSFSPETDEVIGPWCFIGAEDIYRNWEHLPFVDALDNIEEMKRIDLLSRHVANKKTLEWGNKLNIKHNIEHSPVYWRFVLMAWVLFSVQVVLLRYLHIKKFISKRQSTDFTVNLAPSKAPSRVGGFIELQYKQRRDYRFDFWLTSIILRLVAPSSWTLVEEKPNMDWTHFKYQNEPENLIMLERESGIGKLVRRVLGRPSFVWVPGTRISKVFFSIFLNIIPKGGLGKTQNFLLSDSFEDSLSHKFYEVLEEYLLKTIPLSYDEDYDTLYQKSKNLKVSPGRILVDNFMPSSEEKRLKYARALDGGEKFISVQHGSGYGTTLFDCWSAEFEYPFHAFFTWGWKTHGNLRGNFFPLPSPFLGRVKNKHKERNNTIVMAGTKIDLRDSRLIGPRPIQWLKYRESKKDFINSLDLDVSENLVYFPYRRGQSDLIEEAYLKNFFPTLKTGSGGLDSYMLSARLLILDCPGTTLNIAMAANVPLVCFWDKDSFPFVSQAQHYFDELEAVNILHHNVEEAAFHANYVWNNTRKWWNSREVQKARLRWVQQFAYTENLWWWSWLKQLARIQVE